MHISILYHKLANYNSLWHMQYKPRLPSCSKKNPTFSTTRRLLPVAAHPPSCHAPSVSASIVATAPALSL